MANNRNPDDGRPTMPSGTNRNRWEYPGWPASEREPQAEPSSVDATTAPSQEPTPPQHDPTQPRTTSVSPIAMPAQQVEEPPRRPDILPRILTLSTVAVIAAVVGVYAARGPQKTDWAATRARVGADNIGQIVQRTTPPVPQTAAPTATFNLVAADLSLRLAEQRAANWAKGLEPQSTNVRVTFGASGNVVYVLAVDREYLGDVVADCIEDQFRTAKAPPFDGNNVTVIRRFRIP